MRKKDLNLLEKSKKNGKVLFWQKTRLKVVDFLRNPHKRKGEHVQKMLLEASTLLSSSLEYRKILKDLALLAVKYLADWASVDILEKGSIHLIAKSHTDPKKLKLIPKIRQQYGPLLEDPYGIGYVLRTGKTEFIPKVSDKDLTRFSKDTKHAKMRKQYGFRSLIRVPIKIRKKAIGVLSLGSASLNKRFGPLEVKLAKDLAIRAALAFDNALLYKNAQDAIKARDEFLSIASHELKTPLTSIRLQTQNMNRIIKSFFSKNSKTAILLDMLKRTEQQTKRLTTLVNDLLDISRITAGKLNLEKEKVDLSQVTREVVLRFEDELKNAGYTLSLSLSQRVFGTWDRFRIDQVVTNLLSNAIKYGKGKPIEIKVTKKGKNAYLAVSDKGIGIRPKDLKRVFNRFERAVSDRKYKGMGIGLFIVKSIVESHKGKITIKSNVNDGSTFSVELPVR